MKTFKAVDPETHEVVYTHSGEAFKKPYVESGNLHWYGYAGDAIIARYGWNLDRIICGYFDEWCKNHGFKVDVPVIRKIYLEEYVTTEFEFVAPILQEGTI